MHVIAAPVTEAAPQSRKAGKGAPSGEAEAEDSGDGASASPKVPITKAGQIAIAKAKTLALQQALRSAPVPVERLVQLLLLALTARNVGVHTYSDGRRVLAALPSRLLLPGGVCADLPFADVRSAAGNVLSHILAVSGPDDDRQTSPTSGVAAEWIGAAIRADDMLPRFDTAEFLAHVQASELKRLAAEVGMRATGSATALRAMLVGKLPDWRPCAFGAPIPPPNSALDHEASDDPAQDDDVLDGIDDAEDPA